MLIAWNDRNTAWARCPACGHEGEIAQEFSYHAESLRKLAGTDKVAMRRCPQCDARFCDPLVSVDYVEADERGAKFYLESGAGIDVMLEALALADERPVSRYLEIGCAFGFILDYARRILGWEVRGFDPGSLARLGRDTLKLPIENSFFQAGQGFNDWADLVFCSEVIEHIPDPAPFLALLSSGLRADGQLILTTPNGDALREEADPAVLSAILSPGHHIVLYNPVAIEKLLKRHGFTEVRVEENGFQLRVAASRTPLRGRSAWFDRRRYRDYLQSLLTGTGADSPLGAGIAYRLLKEQINGGEHQAARETLLLLRDAYLRRYGFDLDDPATIAVPPESLDFEALGDGWPFNLAGLLYFHGLTDWLGSRQPAKAAERFLAASRIGGAVRKILLTAGVDDLELADLGRQAALARLSALAQCDPLAAAAALRTLLGDEALALAGRRRLFLDLVNLDEAAAAEAVLIQGDLVPDNPALAFALGWHLLTHRRDPRGAAEALRTLPADNAEALSARRRLFLDLVNLAEAEAAEAVLMQGDLTPDTPFLAFALGWHLMTHRRDFARAESAFGQVRAFPDASPELRSRALECRLQSLAEGDPGRALCRRFKEEVNAGCYAEARASFALLREAWLGRYAIDLADPALIPQPAESTDADELLRRWPLSLCAVLYFHGLINWLEAGLPAKAAADFHASARFGASARRVLRREGADDGELADLGRKAGLSRLSALVQYDPQGAAEALLTFTETLPEEDGAAQLAAGARRRLFLDLVNLGHFEPAEMVLASGELGLSDPLKTTDLPVAFAFAVCQMVYKSDFSAAAALFAEIAGAARGSEAEADFFWTARFHQGMAIRQGNLGETDTIAAEMREPAEGLPPVPDSLLLRLNELMSPAEEGLERE